MEQNVSEQDRTGACCGDAGRSVGGCDCCAPAAQSYSWLKLLITGLILLAAFWLAIRSLVAQPQATRDSTAAAASASSGGTATLPANVSPQPGNHGQPSCCGGGNAPASPGGTPPKCGGGTPGCCGQ
jgi:hypothetical protein